MKSSLASCLKRDLVAISSKKYDVIVVGAGIYGACIAWYAALNGLSVALLEKSDFGSATSFNSQKIIHGGIRYLQHGDIKRMRESICERRLLTQLAPHLIDPLPCIVPTYSGSVFNRQLMRIALFLYGLIAFDRNRGLSSENFVPVGRIIPKSEVLDLFPGISPEGLTGGVLWYDGQAYNTERLTLSFVLSAADLGADVANYASVEDFLIKDNRVHGLKVRDVLTGGALEVQGKIVVNAAGPWADELLSLPALSGFNCQLGMKLVKVMVLVTRQITDGYALGIMSKQKFIDEDAIIRKESRLFFITPWHGYSLVGAEQKAYNGKPDLCSATEQEVVEFLRKTNEAFPGAQLSEDDVKFVYVGLQPRAKTKAELSDAQIAKHYRIVDHGLSQGPDGLITVVGVKYTTATDVARKTLALVLRKLFPKKTVRLFCGDARAFRGSSTEPGWLKREMARAIQEKPEGLSKESAMHLVRSYGTCWPRVLSCADEPGLLRPAREGSPVIWAEVIYSIREEMAEKLSDVVLRRTELGQPEYPGDECVRACAELMAKEKGWDEIRKLQEISEVRAAYHLGS